MFPDDPTIIGATIGAFAAIGGATIGGLTTYFTTRLLSIDREKKISSTQLRSSLLKSLHHVQVWQEIAEEEIWEFLCVEFRMRTLKSINDYRYYLPKRKQASFDKAVMDYHDFTTETEEDFKKYELLYVDEDERKKRKRNIVNKIEKILSYT